MSKYVAFLRGINVGGRKIDMVKLEAVFDSLGYKNVSTILRTGNVIFEVDLNDTPKERQMIETALKNRFKYPAIAFIYQIEEVAEIVFRYPYDSAQENFQHYIVFFRARSGRRVN